MQLVQHGVCYRSTFALCSQNGKGTLPRSLPTHISAYVHVCVHMCGASVPLTYLSPYCRVTTFLLATEDPKQGCRIVAAAPDMRPAAYYAKGVRWRLPGNKFIHVQRCNDVTFIAHGL